MQQSQKSYDVRIQRYRAPYSCIGKFKFFIDLFGILGEIRFRVLFDQLST